MAIPPQRPGQMPPPTKFAIPTVSQPSAALRPRPATPQPATAQLTPMATPRAGCLPPPTKFATAGASQPSAALRPPGMPRPAIAQLRPVTPRHTGYSPPPTRFDPATACSAGSNNAYPGARPLAQMKPAAGTVLQRKPDKVTTALIRAFSPGTDNIFGILVDNKVTGDAGGLDGFEVTERISEASRSTIFTIGSSHVSGWMDAKLDEGDTRTDLHAVSKGGVNIRLIKESASSDRTFIYVVKQLFLYKAKASDASTAEPINKSGFVIAHIIQYIDGKWRYQTFKRPQKVTIGGYTAEAGEGEAESPSHVL